MYEEGKTGRHSQALMTINNRQDFNNGKPNSMEFHSLLIKSMCCIFFTCSYLPETLQFLCAESLLVTAKMQYSFLFWPSILPIRISSSIHCSLQDAASDWARHVIMGKIGSFFDGGQ